MFRRILLTCLTLVLMASGAYADTFRVTDIQLEGNDRVEGTTVRAVLTVRPNTDISLDDIDRDLQVIFKLGYFDDISAEVRENGQEKILVIKVHERPLVREILFVGLKKLTEDKLRPLLTFHAPEIYDPVKVKQSIRAMEETYHIEGYYAVKITPELKTDERNESVLTFTVNEGSKVLIDKIVFEGNHAITSKALTKAMMTKKRWMWSWITDRGTYKAEQIQYDIELMTDLYFDQGYMDAKIKQPQISMIEGDKYMQLLFEIEEGPQYKTGKISVTGDLLKPVAELEELVTLKVGEEFSRSKLRRSVLALTDLYADQGYANTNVVPLTSKDPESLTIDLNLRIEKGELIHIEKIKIRGNTITRDKVIRRELSLVEGDLYSATKIKTSRRRLQNLGFFEDVKLSTSKGSSDGADELNIEVTEKPTGTFSIGAGYSSVDSFIVQGSITQANFLGYGLKLNASASLGGTSQLYSIGVTDPYFLDTRWTAGFELYKTRRDWDDYSERSTGGALKGGHPLGRYSKGLLTYRYEKNQIYDVDPFASVDIKDQEGYFTLSSLTGTLNRNTTNNHMDPSTGGITTFSTEYAGLGGTNYFAKFNLSHRHFFPLFWKTILSLHGDIGYVTKTTDSDIPIYKRYYLGGLNTVRGFQTRELGPSYMDPTSGVESFIGGVKAAFFNLEFIFPISEEYKIKGVLFLDGGNAWLENEAYFSDIRYAAGYEFRWVSPMGPLRFAMGYNLDPRGDEKASVFEFSMGSFF